MKILYGGNVGDCSVQPRILFVQEEDSPKSPLDEVRIGVSGTLQHGIEVFLRNQDTVVFNERSTDNLIEAQKVIIQYELAIAFEHEADAPGSTENVQNAIKVKVLDAVPDPS